MTDLCGDVFGSQPRRNPPGSHPAGNDPTVDPQTGRRIPDHVIDSFLDGDLRREDSAKLFSALRNDPSAARDLVGMQRAIDALRQPVPSPDFSAKILAEVGKRKGWLNWSQRRAVWHGRVAAAALLLLLLGGVYVGQRVAPEVTIAGQRPAPINELARAVPTESADAARTVREAVSTVRASVASTVLFARTEVSTPAPVAVEFEPVGPPADIAALPDHPPHEAGDQWRPLRTPRQSDFAGFFAGSWGAPSVSMAADRPVLRSQMMRVSEQQATLYPGVGSLTLGRDDVAGTGPAVILIPGR